MSSTNQYRKSQRGLTLIEVLIALAIVGIAMTAIIKAVSENIRATNYLQNKTMAMWTAQYVINAAQTGVIKLQEAENHKESIDMLNKTLYWQASEEETANRRIKKIDVSVYAQEESEQPILTLESYYYRGE
jgi:general secretion pathway protein I